MNQLVIEPSLFQSRALSLPNEVDLFVGGGRGGGKSYALALLCLRVVEQFGPQARILYIRKTYKGLSDFELTLRDVFGRAYGGGATYNTTEHVWRLPKGAYMELGQLETHADYAKYQGRSFMLLLVDEAGQFANPELLDLLRSNLRGPPDVPIRMVVAANPGGPGHAWLAKRYVFREAPWTPFYEPKSKRTWVYAPSTFEENPFIDRAQYSDQLDSSCPDDPELLRAWKKGDWTVARGAYFASVLDEQRNAIDPALWHPEMEGLDERDLFLAHDYGSSAPSATYVVWESPGILGPDGRFYAKGSLVLLDELATNKPGDVYKGMGWTVPTLAEEIVALSKRWKMKRASGVADDAIFAKAGHATGSIADEFGRCEVYFNPAKKADRLSGWTTMKRLLGDAGKPDVPGLYVSRACGYFWETVPYLARDVRRTEDVATDGADHAADAVRYGCLRHRPQTQVWNSAWAMMRGDPPTKTLYG